MPEDHNEGRRLQTATIAWNVGEVFITILLGAAAGSLALVAFGLDSLIEVFTSVVVLWHMGVAGPGDVSVTSDQSRDNLAHRLVGLAFGALSIYLLVTSVRALIVGVEPDTSRLGIIYLAVTSGVMLMLARAKRGMGRRLRSDVFLAEARMTQLDAYLAIGILSALIVNAAWGWWWADPLAAAAVALLAMIEARSSFKSIEHHTLSVPPS